MDITSYQCALADDYHLAKEDENLTLCGHSVCNKCLSEKLNSTSIVRCKICGTKNNHELSYARIKNKYYKERKKTSLNSAIPCLMDEVKENVTKTVDKIKSIQN
jgi:hypothetical protein